MGAIPVVRTADYTDYSPYTVQYTCLALLAQLRLSIALHQGNKYEP
ncbi:hypothetical protein ACE1TI_00125 [Alteribacillus sp. JSM 102045]